MRAEPSLLCPRPSVDTGMGLERVTAVVQGKLSNYDTDLFAPLLAAIGTGEPERSTARWNKRIVPCASSPTTLRAITFLMADGVLPSNEGRGYVLRRILRRAARHGRLLGITEPFLHELTATVVEQMGEAYHELRPAAGYGGGGDAGRRRTVYRHARPGVADSQRHADRR
jgi:alanyl-tRNA synthetase